jgi:general stress protein 26
MTTEPVVSIAEFRKLVGDMNAVMLTTIGAHGLMSCRPMAPRPLDEMQPMQLWFLTRAHTDAAQQVAQRSSVCVTYQSDVANLYVVVYGHAEEIRDPARVKATWRPMDEVFFPEGAASKDLRLIRVFPEEAVVWRGPGGLVGKAVAFVQALATGDARALGQRAEVRL